MDKKNTMLLTVIAVATLLVAVVGATFAYFSISTNPNEANVSITGKTEEIGSIALNNASSIPSLTLTALEMAKATSEGGNVTYYSSTTSDHSKESYANIITAGVTGGKAATNYQCQATINVAITGIGEGDLTHKIGAGEVILDLKLNDEATSGGSIGTTSFDYNSIGTTKTTDVTFTINGADEAKKILDASLRIVNLQEKEQDKYLAGQTVTATVTASNFSCDPVA